MAQDLKLQVLLSAIDRVTGPMKRIMGGTNATAKALKAAKDRLRELDKAQSQIQGFRKLKNEAASTGTALKASQQQLAKVRASMAGIENPTRKAAAAYARAERETIKLKNAHLAKLRALRDSRNQLKAAGVETKQLGDHERRLRTEMERTNGVIAKQGRALDQLARRNKQLGQARAQLQRSQAMANNAASAGVSMTGAATAVALPAVAMVKTYAEQEAAASQLRAGMMMANGQISADYAKIDALAQKLGNQLPGTTADFYEMFTMLKRQGMTSQVILNGLGEATAYLGAQLRMPYTEAAEFAAKLQDATRATEREMMGLSDTIQRTYYLGVDSQNMLQGFSKLSPALSILRMKGLEATNALAPLLVMADQTGMAGESAGNAFRKVFQSSLDEKKLGRANAQLKELGISLDFSNGKGEFGGLDQMFAQLEKLKNINTQDRLAVIKKLYGDDAETLQVVSLLIDKGAAGYAQVQAKMAEQANLQQRVNGQLGTVSSQWEAATGTFSNAMAAIAETARPEIIKITQLLGEMSGRLQAWVKANPKLTASLFKIAAAGAAVLAVLGSLALSAAAVLSPLAMLRYSAQVLGIKFGPLLTNLRGLAGRALPWLMNGLRALLPLLGGVSAPVLAIGAAIAVAAVLIWKYWQPISAFLRGTFEGVMEVLGELGAEVGAAFAPLQPLFNWLSAGLGKLWNWLKQLLTPMQATSGQLTTATNAGRAFGYAVMTFMTLPLRALIGVLGLAYRGIAAVFAWDPMATIRTVWGRVTAFFGSLKQTFVTLGFQLMQGMASGLLAGLNGVRDSINNASEKVVRWFKEKLGIRSPSRVFAQLGDFTMQGLAGGLDRSQSLPIRAIGAVTKNMRAAGAGMALAAATPAMAIDNRAPIAPAGAAAVGGGNTYNITIHAAGGAAQDIAQQVRAAIEQYDREKAARTRSRLGDNN